MYHYQTHTIVYHNTSYHTIQHQIPTVPYYTHTVFIPDIPICIYCNMPYHTMPYHTIPYHTIPHAIPQHYPMLYHNITLCYTTPYPMLYHQFCKSTLYLSINPYSGHTAEVLYLNGRNCEQFSNCFSCIFLGCLVRKSTIECIVLYNPNAHPSNQSVYSY